MKYLVRSIKSFIWFTCFFAIVIVIMALAIPEYDLSMAFAFDGRMFVPGSQWKILGMFAAVAAIYPSFSYITRKVLSEKPFDEKRSQIMGVFDIQDYVLINEDDSVLTFRKKSAAARFSRMFEDTVTITKGESPFIISGPRKDLLRLISGIESACREY